VWYPVLRDDPSVAHRACERGVVALVDVIRRREFCDRSVEYVLRPRYAAIAMIRPPDRACARAGVQRQTRPQSASSRDAKPPKFAGASPQSSSARPLLGASTRPAAIPAAAPR
jgi:hypothetical protein